MKITHLLGIALSIACMTFASCEKVDTQAPDQEQEEDTSGGIEFGGSTGNNENTYIRELRYTYYKSSSGVNMEVYLPIEDKNIKAAVITCPGGGYSSHAAHEGAVWAPYFNDLGIAFAVLTYTLPAGDPSKPVGDIEKALTILHKMADKWIIDKNKIGVMGFSAGGHLACYAATSAGFAADIKPDFQILMYPVITMVSTTHNGSRTNLLGASPSEELLKKYSNELHVTKDTPKAFISFATNETVVPPATNSVAFYNAMKTAGASVEYLPIEGDRHGWHHDNASQVTQYLTPLKEKLTPWLKNL